MDQTKPPAPFAPLVLVATVAIIGLIGFGANKLKGKLDHRNEKIAEKAEHAKTDAAAKGTKETPAKTEAKTTEP